MTNGSHITPFTPGEILGIEAETTGNIELVRFTLSGAVNDVFTANTKPYVYNRGLTLDLRPGNYTLSVQAGQHPDMICDEKTLSFDVVEPEKMVDNPGKSRENELKFCSQAVTTAWSEMLKFYTYFFR